MIIQKQKNGLTYLAWSYAHQELKKIDPNYTVKVHEFPIQINTENYFVPYLATPEGYFVQVSVTVKDSTETEWLPVLDFRNKSLAKGSATTFDINKAQKRCFVKASALHGLGLYLQRRGTTKCKRQRYYRIRRAYQSVRELISRKRARCNYR